MQQMRNVILIILVVFVYRSSSAQDPELLNNTWYFASGELNGDPFELPFPNFSNNLNFDPTGFIISYPSCEHEDIGSIIYGVTDDTFDLDGGPSTLLGNCAWEFINNHLLIYYDENDIPKNPFVYTIDNNGSILVLTITNDNGDVVIYNNTILSKQDFDMMSLSIYPNPVRDELFFSMISDLDFLDVLIFDLQGRLVKSINHFNSDSIYLQELNAGLYFMRLKDNLGRTVIKKFTKS